MYTSPKGDEARVKACSCSVPVATNTKHTLQYIEHTSQKANHQKEWNQFLLCWRNSHFLLQYQERSHQLKLVAIYQRFLNPLTFIKHTWLHHVGNWLDEGSDANNKRMPPKLNSWLECGTLNLVYSKIVVELYPVQHQHRRRSAKTSGIITMKTLGESLHCNSHVSKLSSLQSNLRMQEVSKLELPQVLVLPALVLQRKLLLGRPKQMSSQKIIVHLHQHQHHLRIIKYTWWYLTWNLDFKRFAFVSIKSFREDVIPLCRVDRCLNWVGDIVHTEQ